MKKHKTLIIFTMIILTLMSLTVICFADGLPGRYKVVNSHTFTPTDSSVLTTGVFNPISTNMYINVTNVDATVSYPLVNINNIYQFTTVNEVDIFLDDYYFVIAPSLGGKTIYLLPIQYVNHYTFDYQEFRNIALPVLFNGTFVETWEFTDEFVSSGLSSLALSFDIEYNEYFQIINTLTINQFEEVNIPMTIITAITAVFTAIGTWFASIIPDMLALFFAEGELTILGALAVAALAIAVILLVLNWILDFFHFRR